MVRIASLCLIAALIAGCGDDDQPAADAAPQPPDANVSGTITFSWTITDGDSTLACADVDATTVSITVQPVGVVGGETDAFGCGGGEATTRGLPPRDYNVELSLRTTEGLLTERIARGNVTVSPQQDTDLGAIEFVVNPVGSFSFTLATEEGGNCEGGAEIVDMELELRKDGTCVPTTFDVGGTDYTNRCGDESFGGCIDSDTVISVTDIASGQYTLAIAGTRDGAACYVTTAQFGVPGNEITSDLGRIDVPLDLANPICNPDAVDAGFAP